MLSYCLTLDPKSLLSKDSLPRFGDGTEKGFEGSHLSSHGPDPKALWLLQLHAWTKATCTHDHLKTANRGIGAFSR